MAELAVRSAVGAERVLAWMYAQGVGGKPDPARAARLYAAGTGAPRNFAEARKWLEQAERGGIATARQLLDWMER